MKKANLSVKKLIEHDENMTTILNVVDALVYVSDMQTHELIFMNQYGIDHWGTPNGKRCWEVLQSDQMGPCDFCTNDRLINDNGDSTGVYVWEFQNTVNNRWYQCRDQAIPWTDGRIVRLEIASDITDRIKAEKKLTIAKQKADKLAHTDDLTGTRNRRAFFKEGTQIFNLAKRYNHPTSIVMMDIDCFKKINDKYGHIIGDKVLKKFVDNIHNNIREVDIFGRIGGEEFALILPETNKDEALKTAEKLRLKVSNMNFDEIDNQLAISSSFGVAKINTTELAFDQALSRADKALYSAKDKGRNRVEYYSDIKTTS